MLISICIPTYNREALLRQTLESLLSQVDPALAEIIISDNASVDDTPAIIKDLQKKHACLKYHRNNQNLGMDDNTLKVVEYASGEYLWFCSDDDVVLPGAFKKIVAVLSEIAPDFAYLNHAGFYEPEDYTVVIGRNRDKPDVVYTSGEQMVRDLRLNHFSSTIIKRKLFLQHMGVTEEYKREKYGRGFAFTVVANHVVLSSPGPFVYIGKLCLAVRNPIECDYDPLLIIVVDHARFYQSLRRKKLISYKTEKTMINYFIRGLYQIIVPLKCRRDHRYTKRMEWRIIKLYMIYPLFYFYMFPLLILPWWVLFVPYWLVRSIKRIAFS